MVDKKPYYTKEELDAMDYFYGTGFYKQYQNSRVKQNKFDTRQNSAISTTCSIKSCQIV